MRCHILFDGLGSEVRNTALGAAFLSALSLAAFYWWFEGDLMLFGVYAVVALLATISVPALYRVSGFTLADEVEWLENRESVETEQLLQRLAGLKDELSVLGVEEGAQQVETLSQILSDYHSVVETRFMGKTQTPVAYLSAARSVQKHAVQNLTDAVAVSHSLVSISRNKSGGESDAHLLSLSAEQQSRLDTLLSNNRNLFAALTDTAVEVANIRSYSDYERMDTLARLISLAEIASHSGK